MRSVFLLVLTVGLLTACATAYQPMAFSGGFEETQLDTNVYEVHFSGNGYTSGKKARDLALLRSADLTKKKGYAYFIITEKNSATSNSTVSMPSTSTTHFAGNSAYTTNYGGQSINVSKPSNTNTIVMFAERPQVSGLVYDAEKICESIGPKYVARCGQF